MSTTRAESSPARVTLEEIQQRRRKRRIHQILGVVALVPTTIAAWIAVILIALNDPVHIAESIGMIETPDPAAPFVEPNSFEIEFLLLTMPLMLVSILTVGTTVFTVNAIAQHERHDVTALILSMVVVILAGCSLMVVASSQRTTTEDYLIEWSQDRYGVDLSTFPPDELRELHQGGSGVNTIIDLETGQSISSYTNSQGMILIDESEASDAPHELPVITY